MNSIWASFAPHANAGIIALIRSMNIIDDYFSPQRHRGHREKPFSPQRRRDTEEVFMIL
jgi:hypothetical protein